jgi:hypothetical protein
VSLRRIVTNSTPSLHAMSAAPAPRERPGHLSRKGRTGWWDVTWTAYYPGREKNIVHVANSGLAAMQLVH